MNTTTKSNNKEFIEIPSNSTMAKDITSYKKNKFTFFKMLIPVSKRKIKISELFDLCNINFNKEEIEKEILKYKLDYNKKYSYDELISNINFKKFYDNFMMKKIKLFGKQQGCL